MLNKAMLTECLLIDQVSHTTDFKYLIWVSSIEHVMNRSSMMQIVTSIFSKLKII